LNPIPAQPLAGIRVLDMSRWIAGSFASMLLGDAGAEVIKLEKLNGEDSRFVAPTVGGTSAYFHQYNRNKKSVSVDFRSPDGLEIVKQLVLWADVVIENFRPGVMEKMGLHYDDVMRQNPRCIYVSISGFGQNGAASQRPGFNTIAEAFSGAMSITGDPQGSPMMSGYFTADHSTGLYANIATLLALSHRQATGYGQRVEISLTDAMFSLLGFTATAQMNDVVMPGRAGNRDGATAPADLFRSSDGQDIYIDAGTDGLFRSLCQMMGDSSLANDPKFSTNDKRLTNLTELHLRIEKWASSTPLAVLVEDLRREGIPYSAVNTVKQAIEDPLYRDNGMLLETFSGNGERVMVPGMAMRFSETPGQLVSGAPMLGQHTREVLQHACGLNANEVEQLIQKNIVTSYDM
jgi:crotonobetainyl-CoA:carnitine CoA-transferase CaiB-like acyl-CoA transferase